MTALAARLKAVAKALEQGKELPPEVLQQLEACLDEIDKVLPPVRRGRPKKPELSWLCWTVRICRGLGVKTDKEVLQRLLKTKTDKEVLQQLLGGRATLKTLRNQLAEARKALK